MSKILGPFILILGVACIAFAMIEFFTLDMWESPKYFWLFFVGAPLVFIGFVLSGKQIQGFMLNQHRDNIRETMKVMGEGLREGLTEAHKKYNACNHGNEPSAIFCSHCGSSM